MQMQDTRETLTTQAGEVFLRNSRREEYSEV